MPRHDFEPVTLEAVEFESMELETIEESDDIEYTGNVEVDSAAEISAVKEGFIARAKHEEARREKATDSEYWVCLCFQNRAQVEAFCTAVGMKTDTKYADGRKLARQMKIDLPGDGPPFGKTSIDRKWANLAMEVES